MYNIVVALMLSALSMTDAVLEDVANGLIDQYRKADYRVEVVDTEGNPVPGAAVTFEQVSHEFLFGGNMAGTMISPKEKQEFLDTFNFATVGSYWILVEKERDQYDWGDLDRQVQWARDNDIPFKLHPGVYLLPAVVPDWAKALSESERKVEAFEYLRLLVKRYPDAVSIDAINEAWHVSGIDPDEVHAIVRSLDPDMEIIVNEYQVLWDGYPEFLTGLEEVDDYDIIGIQTHSWHHSTLQPDAVYGILDQYAKLGKPLQITEFKVQSDGSAIKGVQAEDGNWTLENQRRHVRRMYFTFFAHPAVTAISWWDLQDSWAWAERPEGGLLDKDGNPKPAMLELRRLIHDEWSTEGSSSTDSLGIITFRGFKGEYQVTATKDGESSIIKSGDTVLTLVLDLEEEPEPEPQPRRWWQFWRWFG